MMFIPIISLGDAKTQTTIMVAIVSSELNKLTDII